MQNSSVPEPSAIVRILHLEDNALDAELVEEALRDSGIGFEITRVADSQAFQEQLDRGGFHLILSDYALPAFDGMSALRMARETAPELPFIFVSGTIGEERAVESLKRGAVDYVVKDRLQRLSAAVRRALQEARERTELRRVELALRERNELFRQITENVDDLIAVFDTNANYLFASASFGKLFGGARDFIGRSAFEDIHPEDRAGIRATFAAVTATGTGQRVHYRLVLPDGTQRHLESQGTVIRDESGRVTSVVVVSRDVTEQEEAQSKIRRQAALLDAAQDAIFVCDDAQRITYWNKGAERVYGWTMTEAMGRNAAELLRRDGGAPGEDGWKETLASGSWSGELKHTSKSGAGLVVSCRRTLLREARRAEVAVLHIDTDVTEKMELEAQFLRRQRLETIGVLAGGIAHDLNNVLAPVLMAADMLQEEMGDSASSGMLQIVRASAQRGAELVKQVLQFARGVNRETEALDFRRLADEMAVLARNTFPKSIRIETRLGRDLGAVTGDATQLHQVLLNLCVNARDAMPDGGVLTISVHEEVLRERKFRDEREPVSGRFLCLAISDTGTGIPPEVLKRIFEPFFTTKAGADGTGLGLFTVSNIIRNHHGHLQVESSVGLGTTFRVFLPSAGKPEAPAPSPPQLSPQQGRGEWLLLVEDEAALLEITRRMLESCHYHVLTARNGVEGTRLFQEHQDKIALVITDLMMPAMDGVALIRTIKGLAPEVRVLCVSGMAPAEKLRELERMGVPTTLRKPYTAATLLGAIRSAIGPGSTPNA